MDIFGCFGLLRHSKYKLNQCRLRVNEEITHANPFYDKEQEQINLGKLRKESLDWIEANL